MFIKEKIEENRVNVENLIKNVFLQYRIFFFENYQKIEKLNLLYIKFRIQVRNN